MKKVAEMIAAKLTLLQHLQGEKLLSPDIVPAAKAKLGADLVDGMKGAPVHELLDELIKERDRLEARRFQEADEIFHEWRGKTVKDTVLSCNGNRTRLKLGETEMPFFDTARGCP